ncbi:hypothetical protein [Phormidium sp. FACHB-1136]|uniref:hypothetical protein n=1 Tax=Phormidium sp. FACHB-1136 TaxID=2692848 RepID=UPI0016850C64|nr:hypothetical protein [Phormidium sp. FACHB-1136]MBD2428166.1 hypothetical protein [Phormidium sp. FACHB-1136]
MNKARWMTAAIGGVAVVATLAPFTPAAAEIRSQWLGWGRLRTLARGGPLQDTNRGRDGGSRGSGVCLIAPGNGEVVWTVEPLLVLQGDLKRAALYVVDNDGTDDARLIDNQGTDHEGADSVEPFWTASLSPDTTLVSIQPYDGDPLEPGTTYAQQIEGFAIDGSVVSSRRFPFQIMPEGEERDQIATDLAHLEADLAHDDLDAETIALAKAEFFFERNLNADALGLVFSVEEPSDALAETRQALVEAICSQDLFRDE